MGRTGRLIWLVSWLMPLMLGAQRPRYDKMSPLLRQLARQQVVSSRSSVGQCSVGEVCVFVKATTPQALSDYGCRELARVGQIYIASVPLDCLQSLSFDNRILRMEARMGNSVTTDRMGTLLNALPAYEGRNLPQAYTGQGVVVGLMDIGFDLTHPTFFSSDTTRYRIQQFWDMLSVDTVGSPFYVGRDYVGRDALLSLGHSRDGLDMTHGTHTAGIAAGSGYNSSYRGMAPEADLCLVANAVSDDMVYIDSADHYKYTFATDALGFKYMFDYAKKTGKPCVLSFSEGSGQDFWGNDQLYYEMLDSLVGPGRILVSAAGNNGYLKSWFRKPRGVDAMGTFLYNGSPSMMFTLKSASQFILRMVTYGEKNDTLLIPSNQVLAQEDSLLTLTNLSIEAYPSCYASEEICYDVMLTGGTTIGGSPKISVELLGSDADVEFWRVNGALIDDALNPSLNAGEMVRNILSPSSAPCVICVGATNYRDSIQNREGQWMKYWQGEAGMRIPFSSIGPTYDGRVKPDVMAPGNNIISSYSSFFREAHPTSGDFLWEVDAFDFNGRTYSWTSNAGTSSACPAVAGAIALWLQAKPDLTPEQVMGVIQRTSRQPDVSLSYPNNYYGFGEIDVYRGLLDILGVDRIEAVSTTHTSARITLSNGLLTIRLTEPTAEPLRLRLYNLSGNLVKATAMDAGQTVFTVSVGHLPAGVYAVQLDGPSSVRGSSLVRL